MTSARAAIKLSVLFDERGKPLAMVAIKPPIEGERGQSVLVVHQGVMSEGSEMETACSHDWGSENARGLSSTSS